jgi:tetratricopeptide (TPR) repeat protein
MHPSTRIVALHGALWSSDRWYRLAWYVWPAALALLICGWICIDKPAPYTPGSPGTWAKPLIQSANNTATQFNNVQADTTKCFSDPKSTYWPAGACTRLIDTGQVKGRQLAAVYARRGFLWRESLPDLALRDYDSALKVQPDFADALTGRAWIRMTFREYDAAFADLNRAIDVLPAAASGVAHYYRGYAFVRVQDYTKALADLDEAQKYTPNNADIYLTRGEAEQAQQDNEAALRDFDEFIKRSPKDYRGFVWRSGVLEVTGRTQEALAAMESALVLEPGNETVRAERDRLRAKQNEDTAPK